MYSLEVKPEADKIFKKLAKRSKNILRIIEKKIFEIRSNPHHAYKFLAFPLQNLNRAHINSHFVMIFRIDHQAKKVIIYCFDHHDLIYKWRPRNQ